MGVAVANMGILGGRNKDKGDDDDEKKWRQNPRGCGKIDTRFRWR
jgi:hypothetical protein